MLHGIHPLLSGTLLHHLDDMGHSDTVVVADANFPAQRLGARVIDLPSVDAPAATAAVRTVLPLDTGISVRLMESATGATLPVQAELITAAGCAPAAADSLERAAFYAAAAQAYLVVRTGERRAYGNVILAKGIVENWGDER